MKQALSTVLAIGFAASAFAGEAGPLGGLRLEDLTATRERPLFAPTRRPPPVHADAPAPEPSPVEERAVVLGPPPFDLLGAVVGKGAAFALLRDRATSEVVRVRRGDEAGGWRVGAIGLRSVALVREGRQETLALAVPQPVPVGAEVAGEPSPAPRRDFAKSRQDR